MYIGNDLQIAHPSYKIIDDISSGFNGSTTSFALQVSGATPVPFPISTQQVMISVNGVVQEPDPTGNAGFKLLGSNIVFSSAPANGHAFFGVINAGADYVTAGSEFPDGSVTAPSFTFQDDQDTGWFRIGSGSVGYSANGVQILDFDGNGLNIPDNKKLQIGSGTDLQIYHDGSNSYIDEAGIGQLTIRSSKTSIQKYTGEICGTFTADGAVELYHDNAKKLETFASGITVLGSEGSAGQIQLFSDEGDDDADKWRLTKEAGNSSFRIQNYTSGSWETNILATGNGAVELYHDNVKKFETSAAGVVITGVTASDPTTTIYHSNADVIGEAIRFGRTDLPNIRYHSIKAEHSGGSASNMLQFHIHNGSNTTSQTEVLELTGDGKVHVNDSIKFECGTGGDLQIWHDSSNSYITNTTGVINIQAKQTENSIVLNPDGAVELYYDNSKKFETKSFGAEMSGRLAFPDSIKATWGTGDDLEIYHASNESKIVNQTGSIWLQSDNGIRFTDHGLNQSMAAFYDNGACELYHNGTKKIETTSSGVTVSGTVSDNLGDVRKAIQAIKSSAYTITNADAGKHIFQGGSGGTITAPTGMEGGDMVTVVNGSGGDITIAAASGLTIYNTADAATGNRTLANRGVATLLFTDAATAYISGAGLS